METKKVVKEDVKKLKKFAHHAQDWAASVQSSLELTKELCKFATGVVCHDSNKMQQLDGLLQEVQETVAASLGRVTSLADARSSEISKEVDKKGLLTRYSKTSPYSQDDVQLKVQHAQAAVGVALFEAVQVQARELDRIAAKSLSLVNARVSQASGRVSTPLTPTVRGVCGSTTNRWSDDESGSSVCKSTPEGENCVIDWDGFEEDLQAMTTAVRGSCVNDVAGSTSSTEKISGSHDLIALGAHSKEYEMERDDAMRHAREVEENLRELKRQHESLVEESKKYYTEDDIMELQTALKREQLDRMNIEAELRLARASARAAEDNAEATQFALVVAQQVAAKMARAGSLQRRRSSGSIAVPEARGVVGGSQTEHGDLGSGIRSRTSVAGLNIVDDPLPPRSSLEVRRRLTGDEIDDAQSDDVVIRTATARSDSAFMPQQESSGNQEESTGDGLAAAVEEEPSMEMSSQGPQGPLEPVESSGVDEISETNPFLMDQAEPEDCEARETFPEERKKEKNQPHRVSSLREDKGQYPLEKAYQKRLSASLNDTDTQKWNPFERIDSGSGSNSLEARSAISDSQPPGDHSCFHEKEAWNPFSPSTGSSMKHAVDDVDQGNGDASEKSWNPFTLAESSKPVSNNRALYTAPEPLKSDENSSKNDWNPFDPPECKKGGADDWNPFLCEAKAPLDVTAEPTADWNPFSLRN